MNTYRVIWEIDIDAENEVEAAQKALQIQRDSNSEALFFDVKNVYEQVDEQVDLNMHELPDGDIFQGSLTPEERDELYEIAIEDEYNNGEL